MRPLIMGNFLVNKIIKQVKKQVTPMKIYFRYVIDI